MGNYIDFDAARADRVNEPLMLHAYGMDFELPGSIPAALFLDIVRMNEEQGAEAEMTTKDALSLLRRVMPQAVLDTLLARDDFSLGDFSELTSIIVQTYMDVQPGNSPAPNRATRRATKSTQSRGSQGGSTIPKAPTGEPGETS